MWTWRERNQELHSCINAHSAKDTFTVPCTNTVQHHPQLDSTPSMHNHRDKFESSLQPLMKSQERKVNWCSTSSSSYNQGWMMKSEHWFSSSLQYYPSWFSSSSSVFCLHCSWMMKSEHWVFSFEILLWSFVIQLRSCGFGWFGILFWEVLLQGFVMEIRGWSYTGYGKFVEEVRGSYRRFRIVMKVLLENWVW